MKKNQIFHFFCAFFLVVCLFSLSSDERTENIDVFIVLDKSLSMVEEIEAVKSYVTSSLIQDVLIPGDFLVLIAFYGQAETLIVQEMTDKGVQSAFAESVSKITADGRYTDIGNALDALQTAVSKYRHKNRREYLLLITDGKQEAPPGSKYYSEDGSFNHAFLENTRTIQKEGWKIHILGIGTASAAREIAEELSGGYTEITEKPTEEVLKETTNEFLGRLEVKGSPVLADLAADGTSTLSLAVKSIMFSETKSIIIKRINLSSRPTGNISILERPFTASVPAEETIGFEIPVQFPRDVPKGTYEGTITVVFDGDTVFVPAVMDVSFSVKGFFGNNIWLIPVISLAVLVLIALVILLVFRGSLNRGITFRFHVDSKPAHKGPVKLKDGESIFIKRNKNEYELESERSAESLAQLTSEKKGLTLKVLSKEKFKVIDELAEGSILGRKFRVKNDIGGGYKTFLFRIA